MFEYTVSTNDDKAISPPKANNSFKDCQLNSHVGLHELIRHNRNTPAVLDTKLEATKLQTP